MGLATHLGPWLLGTVKDTTSSAKANLGATVVAQSGTVAYTDTTAKELFTIPAGAYITGITVDVGTAFNAGTNNTLTITDGTSTLATITATGANITVGRKTTEYTTTVSLLTNVGTSDKTVYITYAGTGTAATTGAATVMFSYVVRKSDGTYTAAYTER